MAEVMSGVYFIQAGRNGPVKVGSSVNVRKRFNALQSGHYEQLEIVKYYELDQIDQVAVECALNARFRKFWIRGEWFQCNVLNFDTNAMIGEILKEIRQQRVNQKSRQNALVSERP